MMSTSSLITPRQSAQLMRYHVRQALGRWPRVYLPLARLRNGRHGIREVVRPETELVIEGFPRSANTFTVTAFRHAQPRPVEIAHHLHLPVQVLYALERDIPVLLLIREPSAAIVSYMLHSKYPTASPLPALHEYLRFYQTLRPYRERVVLASFDEVTSDFGAVIRRINTRYGTDFACFKHTSENVAACFEQVEAVNRRRHGGRVLWSNVTRPHVKRDEAKGPIRERLERPEFATLLSQAQGLYRELTN